MAEYTLDITDQEPKTFCKNCPQALWHLTVDNELRVFCRLMHALIDKPLLHCDGIKISEMETMNQYQTEEEEDFELPDL